MSLAILQEWLALSGIPYRLNPSLAQLTSLGAGAEAALLVEPQNTESLLELFTTLAATKVRWFLIGKGTNLVAWGPRFEGVLIKLGGEFTQITRQGNRLQAGAGAVDAKVARYARKEGLSGLEWLVTVPGTLGGALRMNAGAHGAEIKDHLIEAHLFHPDRGLYKAAAEELELAYRSSRLSQTGELALSLTFELNPQDPEAIAAKERELLNHRRQSQPVGIKTFGSVFANPPDASAWRLIEQAGLRGKQIGNFRLHPKHCNFMQNQGSGNPEGLIELIELVQSEVQNKTGQRLVLEGNLFPPR
ncbi:MAG: UDP-N-acetylmuramate dehydrogenase [bacterium]|nr:UDP-N-acetylmuramate dehydrogenase [bacterium]